MYRFEKKATLVCAAASLITACCLPLSANVAFAQDSVEAQSIESKADFSSVVSDDLQPDNSSVIKDGWQRDESSGVWYYGKNGKHQTGWLQSGGYWYWLDPANDGAMQTGYFNVTDDGGLTASFYANDGNAATPFGALYQNCWLRNTDGNWFYANAGGDLAAGWFYQDGTWYYLDPVTHIMQVGFVDLGSGKYYLDASGAMKTGWVAVNGSWYYLNSSGFMQTGWLNLGGTWYWLDASGAMATGWRVVDGSWNYFMANGAWVSDYMDAKAQSYSSNTNWLILVDTSRCITSIYTGSWNNWSLNRRYVCSTGKASTPTVIGEYQVYGKGYSFGHGYTCYYYTQFYGDYLFHSSPYYVNSNRVMDPTMGVPSSAGCVRLEIQNAKWIYDNIPYGTKVVTY